MPAFFRKMEKLKPVYDATYKALLFLCKLLLIGDTLITAWAVAGRYIPFITDPHWSEEMVLTFMVYMAVLSATLAIRKRAHIRMTAFDVYLPKKVINILDLLADAFVLVLAFVMLTVGWKYAVAIGSKGTYVSIPGFSRFWMYFPIPVAGFAMIIFELEAIYNHIKELCAVEEGAQDAPIENKYSA